MQYMRVCAHLLKCHARSVYARVCAYMLACWNSMHFKRMKYKHFYCMFMHILNYILYMLARIYISAYTEFKS